MVNYAKHSNRHNFISVQDIDTNFACIVGFSGSAISNMLSKITGAPRELPWQPNLGKNEPKLNKTSCLDRIVRRRNVTNGSEDVFLWILVPICDLIFKKLQFPLFFAKIDKIAYTSNSKDAKHSNRHNFICVQDIDTIFACIVGLSGSANSNMLSKISREPRELPWQPNFGKNKPKLH